MKKLREILKEAPHKIPDEEYPIGDNRLNHNTQLNPSSNDTHFATSRSGHKLMRRDGYGKSRYYYALSPSHDPEYPSHEDVDMMVYGHIQSNGHFEVDRLKGREGSKIRAHQFYHHIIHDDNQPIQSSENQSTGGQKTWRELSKHSDIEMTHHTASGRKIKLHPYQFWDSNYRNQDVTATHFRARKKE